jgi:hypothetical protein
MLKDKTTLDAFFVVVNVLKKSKLFCNKLKLKVDFKKIFFKNIRGVK